MLPLTCAGDEVIIAPLQGRAIVTIVARLALVAVRGLSAPQRGFGGVLLFDALLAVLQRCQTGLHIVELRSVDDVFRTRGKDCAYLFLGLEDRKSTRLNSSHLGISY